MNKGYVILVGSVDETTCNDDGFINCSGFGLALNKVYYTKEEAVKARTLYMTNDLEDTKMIWDDNYYNKSEDRLVSPYTFKVGLFNDDDEMSDASIDVYFNSEITNETIYKIQEVEL